MFSLEVINALNQDIAAKAKQQKRLPLVLTEDDIQAFPSGINFPALGNYQPKGWELVGTLFCDKTGMGLSSEPALTLGQLKARLEPGKGYALIEEGQFQIVLGVFERKSHV